MAYYKDHHQKSSNLYRWLPKKNPEDPLAKHHQQHRSLGKNKPSARRKRDQKKKIAVDRTQPEEVAIEHHPPGPNLESSGQENKRETKEHLEEGPGGGFMNVESCPANSTEVFKASSRLKCGRDWYGNNQYVCAPNVEKTALVEFCYGGIMRPIPKVMNGIVESCPANATEVDEASSRLKCGRDWYGNIQYVCAPNVEKTALVEFCYDGIMRPIPKGNCLEINKGAFVNSNCTGFVEGCPEKYFRGNAVYKHPACMRINIDHRCYLADPSCPNIAKMDVYTTLPFAAVVGSIVGLVAIVIIGILIAFICWKRRKKLKRKDKPDEEENSGLLHPLHSRNIDNTESKDLRNRDVGAESNVFDFGNEIRIILLGKTGNGKSATGNLILGEELFETKMCARSVTVGCNRKRKKRFGVSIDVVDTQGLCDTKTPNEIVFKEILKCIAITSPGPHAFLLVLSVASRFTPEEEETVNNFISRFGEHIFQYLIVVITRKDELEREKMSKDQYLGGIPPSLKTFLHKCGNRCMFLNNKDNEENKEKQCFDLLTMINENIKGKNHPYYTDKACREAERIFKEREEEKRKKANEELRKQIEEEIASMKASNEEKESKMIELLEEKDKMLNEMRDRFRNEIENETTEDGGTFQTLIGDLKQMGCKAVNVAGEIGVIPNRHVATDLWQKYMPKF